MRTVGASPTRQEQCDTPQQRDECHDLCLKDALEAWKTMTELVDSAGKFALQYRLDMLQKNMRMIRCEPAEHPGLNKNPNETGDMTSGEQGNSMARFASSGLRNKKRTRDSDEKEDERNEIQVYPLLGMAEHSLGTRPPPTAANMNPNEGENSEKKRGGSFDHATAHMQSLKDSLSVSQSRSQDVSSFAKENELHGLDVLAQGITRLRDLMNHFQADIQQLVVEQQSSELATPNQTAPSEHETMLDSE